MSGRLGGCFVTSFKIPNVTACRVDERGGGERVAGATDVMVSDAAVQDRGARWEGWLRGARYNNNLISRLRAA